MPNLHIVELNSTTEVPKVIIALLSGEPHTFDVSVQEYSLLLTLLKSICQTDNGSSILVGHSQGAAVKILRDLQKKEKSTMQLGASQSVPSALDKGE